MVTDEQIRDLVARIAAEFHPQRIILFGSRARGEAHAESDVDLLVVMPFEGRRYRTAARIRAHLPREIPIDLVLRSPAEVESENALGDILLQDALQSGITLYRAAA